MSSVLSFAQKHLSESSLVVLTIATLVSIGTLERSYFALENANTASSLASITLSIHHPAPKPVLPHLVIPNHTLRGGDEGLEVVQLQNFLKTEGFFASGTPATGHFGPNTEQALKKYQAKHHLEATGTLGPLTRSTLSAETQ